MCFLDCTSPMLCSFADLVLRKMFSRVLKMAAPTWSIKEASNGETALKVVDTQQFDVIFIDQVSNVGCVHI